MHIFDFISALIISAYVRFNFILISIFVLVNALSIFQIHINMVRTSTKCIDMENGLHVKIPENYFKILEEGKNVGKFIFRRNVKIPENEPRKRKNPGNFFRK